MIEFDVLKASEPYAPIQFVSSADNSHNIVIKLVRVTPATELRAQSLQSRLPMGLDRVGLGKLRGVQNRVVKMMESPGFRPSRSSILTVLQGALYQRNAPLSQHAAVQIKGLVEKGKMVGGGLARLPEPPGVGVVVREKTHVRRLLREGVSLGDDLPVPVLSGEHLRRRPLPSHAELHQLVAHHAARLPPARRGHRELAVRLRRGGHGGRQRAVAVVCREPPRNSWLGSALSATTMPPVERRKAARTKADKQVNVSELYTRTP